MHVLCVMSHTYRHDMQKVYGHEPVYKVNNMDAPDNMVVQLWAGIRVVTIWAQMHASILHAQNALFGSFWAQVSNHGIAARQDDNDVQ